jgi:hypothetical protein
MSPMQPEAGTMPARTERTPAGSFVPVGGKEDCTGVAPFGPGLTDQSTD